MTTSATTPPRIHRAAPRTAFHSAWILPVLVLGQFTLLGAVPVALIAMGTIRGVKDGALRWLAGLLTAAYLVPLLIWAVNPDRAESLSKDISPIFAALIVGFCVAFLLRAFRLRTR